MGSCSRRSSCRGALRSSVHVAAEGVAFRRRYHQTPPPIRTAAARMPNAIQPHCVLSSGWSFVLVATAAPAAAAAAGLTDVVVATVVTIDVSVTLGAGAVVVTGGGVTTVVCVRVCVSVSVTVRAG